MAFSTFNSFTGSFKNQIIKLNISSSIIGGYTFRVKGTTSTVPTTDVSGTPILNKLGNGISTGSLVTMYNDPSRGYVFSFSGSNYLQINLNSAAAHTKTFWVSSSTPESNYGTVFSSGYNPSFFGSTKFLLNSFYTSNGSSGFIETRTPPSTVSQGISWIFYAVTVTATSTASTSTSLYINGVFSNTTQLPSGAPLWANDASFQFGASGGDYRYTGYLDDIRFYPSVLSDTQILQIYNGQ
jgi:hypothetical protein